MSCVLGLTEEVYKTEVPFFKNHVCRVQIFSFVIMTRYKLSASTFVNQRNRNKE